MFIHINTYIYNRRLHRNPWAGANGKYQVPDEKNPQLFHVYLTFSLDVPEYLRNGTIIPGIGVDSSTLDAAFCSYATPSHEQEDEEDFDDSDDDYCFQIRIPTTSLRTCILITCILRTCILTTTSTTLRPPWTLQRLAPRLHLLDTQLHPHLAYAASRLRIESSRAGTVGAGKGAEVRTTLEERCTSSRGRIPVRDFMNIVRVQAIKVDEGVAEKLD